MSVNTEETLVLMKKSTGLKWPSLSQIFCLIVLYTSFFAVTIIYCYYSALSGDASAFHRVSNTEYLYHKRSMKMRSVLSDSSEALDTVIDLFPASKFKNLKQVFNLVMTSSYKVRTDLEINRIYDVINFTSAAMQNVTAASYYLEGERRKKEDGRSKLKIFWVLHSHNDAGWGSTFLHYYKFRTRQVLNFMLENLSANPDLKFIWVEICFFSLWWDELSYAKKDVVKKLVQKKQLEFVGGGWVMPDEASVHYFSHLTQQIEGNQWLMHHLNYTTSNGWAIDPFGLSPSVRYLNRKMGLQNTVFLRAHYALKEYFKEKKLLEFLWRQQWGKNFHFPMAIDSSGSTDMLCYLMPYESYTSESTCGPNQNICTIFEHPLKSHTAESIVRQRSLALLEQYRNKSLLFQTNNVLVPLGGDFRWMTSQEWSGAVENLNILKTYINSHPELNAEVKFATLSDYFEAIKSDPSFKPKTLSGDFFPYADKGHEYWSGYFTSRIFHKRTERQLMSFVRGAQIIYTIMIAEIFRKFGTLKFPIVADLVEKIVESRRNFSVFQHHDGITGTSARHVVRDYAKMMDASMLTCQFVTQQAMQVLANLGNLTKSRLEGIDSDGIYYLNIAKRSNYIFGWEPRILNVTKASREVVVGIYNPLETSRTELVEVRVSTLNVKVLDLNDNEIESELEPVFKTPFNYQKNDYDSSLGRFIVFQPESVRMERFFKLHFVAQVRPLSVKHYRIVYTSERSLNTVNITVYHTKVKSPFQSVPGLNVTSGGKFPNSVQISNLYFNVSFSRGGTLETVEMGGKRFPLNITFHHYTSTTSGLYIFMPEGKAKPVQALDPVVIKAEGRLFSYVEVWLPTVRHKLILFNHSGLECHSLNVKNVIDVKQQHNYELIMRFNTGIESGGDFYTDSNGLQMIHRRRRANLPIQGNYYPMATSAFIEDPSIRFTLLAAQPGGVTSLESGELEVMLDRILNQDDNKGLGESGTDNLVTTSRFKLLLEVPLTEDFSEVAKKVPMITAASHQQSNSLLHPLQIYTRESGSEGSVQEDYYIPGSKPIPCDMHLVAAAPMPDYIDSPEEGMLVRMKEEIPMILHRVGVDPRFEADYLQSGCILQFANQSCRMRVKSLWGDLMEDGMQMMSLNFGKVLESESFDGRELLPLQPLQVYAFRAHFRDSIFNNVDKSFKSVFTFKKTQNIKLKNGDKRLDSSSITQF